MRVFATLLTAGLVIYQRYVVRRTNSTAIRADSLHYVTDLLSNISVIIALILSVFQFYWADGLVALLVAAYIIYSATQIAYESLQQLMDREISEEETAQVLAVANANPHALGVHDLRTRRSGQRTFIQMHLDLDASLTLHRAHEIAEEVRIGVEALFTDVEVIIHQDPIGAAHTPDDV